MSDPTWGGLVKSQIDDQLITEAIAEAIAVHNDDPTAHLGGTRSLEVHKANEVIDHPAFSIVPDKLFGGDIVIKTQFESLDPWFASGSVSIDAWNGLKLYTEYGVTNTSRVDSNMYENGEIFDDTKDIYFETQMRKNMSNNHFNAWFGFISNYNDTRDGFGFQVRDGALYAHASDGTTNQNTLITGITLSNSNFYSALYSVADQTVTFKINGEVVATLDVAPDGDWNDDRTPFFGCTLTQSNDGALYFQYLYAWRKVLTV